MLSGEIPGIVGPFADVVGKLRREATWSRSARDVLVAGGQLALLLVIWGKRLRKSASTIAQTKVRARICRGSGML